ncbi:MAG: hypothetical protein M1814_004163 [Vezdaea aestivalis]|nr:MAG: hypothetical protein M1814_004163 [Vezdaea aestivalis]
MTGDSSLPFWLVNVPQNRWPKQCPDFLVNANAKDRGILSTPDIEYNRLGWDDVKSIIKSNRIDRFQRVPSDLRRYWEYNWNLKSQYGSVMNFVLQERLRWDRKDLLPKGPAPFADSGDIKILYNDWPYGIDLKIVHLVVWTKFNLEDDPATDDLTAKARKEIEDFVESTFCSRMPLGDVIWFKNWKSLKSVHAVEHFHVMLFDPPKAFIEEVTDHDIPLSEKISRDGVVSADSNA